MELVWPQVCSQSCLTDDLCWYGNDMDTRRLWFKICFICKCKL